MKKFFAMILSLIMIMSLSVPAFAADVTITDSNDGYNTTSQNVTASYTADVPTITSLTMTVNGKEVSTNSQGSPFLITSSDEVTFTVYGENFNMMETGYIYYAVASESGGALLTYLTDSSVTIDTASTPHSATLTVSGDVFQYTTRAIQVQACGCETIESTDYDSGIWVKYVSESELPTITGVEITSGYARYDEASSTYTITPGDDPVVVVFTGTNFENLTSDYTFFAGIAANLSHNNVSVDTVANTLTITTANENFNHLQYASEIKYRLSADSEFISMGKYMIYQTELVSVDISWGDMAFTYRDSSSSWSCDNEGGDQITVSNSGDATVVATVKYTANNKYTEITGEFDADSATLAKDENKVFTLTLKNKPNSNLDNATIGQVTVTITKPTE